MLLKMVKTKAKILYNKRVKGDYLYCILHSPLIAKEASPGQFINVRVSDDGEPLLRRPFSIYKIKDQRSKIKDQVGILYEVLGKGTEILSCKKPGEYLDVIGPLGNGFDYLELKTSDLRPILVAGGIGVAPLVFLAEKLTRLRTTDYELRTLVLIGAKTKNQILCEKEFQRLGCSVKIATDDGSRGFKGRVTDLLEEMLASGFGLQASRRKIKDPAPCIMQSAAVIYSCGPRPMLKEVTRICQGFNIPAQISLEEHMACGIGACLGCAVKTQGARRMAGESFEYKRICKEGPVFDANEVIW